MTYTVALPRKTFSQRFSAALIWLGLPLMVIAVAPIAAVLLREGLPGLFATEPFHADPLHFIAKSLLVVGCVEVVGVYAWHARHFGYTLRGLSRNDRYLMTAPSMAAAPIVFFLELFRGDGVMMAVAFVIVFLAATFFTLAYARATRRMRKAGAGP